VPKTVNLLFDSVNDNTGDRAIGEVMLRFVLERGAEPKILDPEEKPSPSNLTVVGGGELLRAPGDPFYDAFRLKGRHVLNAAGVTSSTDMEYLSEYAYVSVRSEADKAMIEEVRPDAVVVPDVAMALDPAYPPEEVSQFSTVFFHVHSNMLHHCQKLPTILRQLQDLDVRWISLTPYAGDAATMVRIGALADREIPLSMAETPAEKLGAIYKCRLLVCASFHGALFAYTHNVPFLVFARPGKVRAFLAERGLEDRGFHSSDDLSIKLERALGEKADFSSQIEKDKVRLGEHFEAMAEVLRLPKRPRKKLSQPPSLQPKHTVLHSSFYKQALQELDHFAHQYRKVVREQESWRTAAERAREETKPRPDQLLGEVAHQLWRLNEEIRHSTETRALQRTLKLAKRTGKVLWPRLPEWSRQMLRPAVEAALGRPLGGGPSQTAPNNKEDKYGASSDLESEGGPRKLARIRAAPEDSPGLHRTRQKRAKEAVVFLFGERFGGGAPLRRERASSGCPLLARASILIPTKNAGPHFGELLQAVRCSEGGDEAEIIVADSESADATLEVAKSFGARVIHVEASSFNHGETRNYLASEASGEYLIFLTQDALPATEATLENLIAVVDSAREIAAASGRQVPRSGADLYGAFSVYQHNRFLGLDRSAVFPEGQRNFDSLTFIERRRWVSGADNVCCAYRREVLEKLGFRRVRFGEDLDFAVRALNRGFKLGYCHEAPVIHSHDRSALYHMRRHIADRTCLAELLVPTSRSRFSDGPLATVAYLTANLIRAVDLCLAETQARGLVARLHKVSEEIKSGADEAVDQLDSEWHESELQEVYDALLWISGSVDEEPYDRSVSFSDLRSLLRQRLAEYLRAPILLEFASANDGCGANAGRRFIARVAGGLAGTFVGDASRAQRDLGPIEELLRGL